MWGLRRQQPGPAAERARGAPGAWPCLLGVSGNSTTNTGTVCQTSEGAYENRCYVKQASGTRLCH